MIQVNRTLKEKVDLLATKEERIDECETTIENLKQEIADYQTKIEADKELLKVREK